jgi:hypothetical protein
VVEQILFIFSTAKFDNNLSASFDSINAHRLRNGPKSDGGSNFNGRGAEMRVYDVGERGVKGGSYFLSCRRIQKYNTNHGYIKKYIFYYHSSLHYVKRRWKKIIWVKS